MKLLVPVVIIVALIAFVAGMSIKNYFVSPFNAVSQSEKASDSAQIVTKSDNVPQLSNESAPAGTVHSQNGNSYTSQNLPDKVVMNGKYMLSSYKINFSITLPKNGEDITGSVSGACEGTITGKADKPNSHGQASIHGEYSGDCKPIPTLGFKTKASGTFEGKADYNKGQAGITYENKHPLESRGYFELSF